jgi:hypothetical protein
MGVKMNDIQTIESKVNYYKSELLSKRINGDLLINLNDFMQQMNTTVHENPDFYIGFLNDLITLLPNQNYNLSEIDQLFFYNAEKNKILNILQNAELSIANLRSIDEFFLDKKVLKYLNIDIKSLRLIEDKLYRKLLSKENGINIIYELMAKKERLPFSLGIYLAIDFYRKSKHPAQVVTFSKGLHIGHYNHESGNINIDIDKFLDFVNKEINLKDKPDDNLLYNLELMRLVYHECVHFKMLYQTDEYHYETELSDIASDYNTDDIHDSFFLEFSAEAEACIMAIDLIKRLNYPNHEYAIYLLENAYQDVLGNYYHVINGVRTSNPHEFIYQKLEEIITKDSNHDDKYKQYSIERLHKNKNEQELVNSVFDEYVYQEEELKKIFLVIMLEHSMQRTYSRFNQDVIKDLITMNYSDVILKYQKPECKKSLQELYLTIQKAYNYNDASINVAIMRLPMDYPFLNIIQILSNKESLVNSKA